MSNYSSKEKMMATILSATPGLKKWIKKAYVMLNYWIYKKSKPIELNHKIVRSLGIVPPADEREETFFGYYDASPENGRGDIIYFSTNLSTSRKPTPSFPLKINIYSSSTGKTLNIGETYAYNWQQGARALWLNADTIVYNIFCKETNKYMGVIFDVKSFREISRLQYPVQDAFKDEYLLSVNYRRIMRLRPDYGYRNLPPLNDVEMRNLQNDGIIRTDLASGKSQLILSLQSLTEVGYRPDFNDALHKINHVMISPSGDRYIFIHRWYKGGRRFDRLMLGDFEGCIRTIADEGMVSHMHWVSPSLLFGYLRLEGKPGFYFIDINTMSIRRSEAIDQKIVGDGHPTVRANQIIFDSYPDRSGMQHLYRYDINLDTLVELGQFKHSPKYWGECRCDLHPRLSQDGTKVFLDSVAKGKRQLCYLDLITLENCNL